MHPVLTRHTLIALFPPSPPLFSTCNAPVVPVHRRFFIGGAHPDDYFSSCSEYTSVPATLAAPDIQVPGLGMVIRLSDPIS